ncbi:hypothetical protein ACLOJK_008765 [Asimina triloba]
MAAEAHNKRGRHEFCSVRHFILLVHGIRAMRKIKNGREYWHLHSYKRIYLIVGALKSAHQLEIRMNIFRLATIDHYPYCNSLSAPEYHLRIEARLLPRSYDSVTAAFMFAATHRQSEHMRYLSRLLEGTQTNDGGPLVVRPHSQHVERCMESGRCLRSVQRLGKASETNRLPTHRDVVLPASRLRKDDASDDRDVAITEMIVTVDLLGRIHFQWSTYNYEVKLQQGSTCDVRFPVCREPQHLEADSV